MDSSTAELTLWRPALPSPLVFQLLTNADRYARAHVGTRTILLCAGKIVWIGSNEYCAADACQRYDAARLPQGRVTISSDGGGCMPRFAADGRPVGMDVGTPSELSATLRIGSLMSWLVDDGRTSITSRLFSELLKTGSSCFAERHIQRHI